MNPSLTERIKIQLSDIRLLWAVCFIFNIITFLTLFFKIHPGNQTLALHYNVLVGVEWYGKGKNLYFIPGVGLAVTSANLILYRTLKDKGNFFPFLTVFASLCTQTILFAATLFLVKVN